MKKLFISSIFILCIGCNDKNRRTTVVTETDSSATIARQRVAPVPQKEEPATNEQLLDFKNLKRYALTDTIRQDLNGDGIAEKTWMQHDGEKRYIKIENGSDHQVSQVGSDSSFLDLGSDFGWIDFWGITLDKKTHEILFVNGEVGDTREVALKHPSIVVRKEEQGGGVITWREGAYIWVHQSD
jgi:hypothetical protein